jgi:hypothetical protein
MVVVVMVSEIVIIPTHVMRLKWMNEYENALGLMNQSKNCGDTMNILIHGVVCY